MMRKLEGEEEGVMGIGTLIIFIAMILVAAVAASVLISTTFNLQQQALRTGEEAILEVSSSFMVYGKHGVTNETNSEIGVIKFQMGLAAGSNPQNLHQTVIQVLSSDADVNLLAMETANGEGNSTHYGWRSVIKQEGEDGSRYMESGDLYEISINVSATDIGWLGPQHQLDINIIPKHGTPTYLHISTPSTITTKIVRM